MQLMQPAHNQHTTNTHNQHTQPAHDRYVARDAPMRMGKNPKMACVCFCAGSSVLTGGLMIFCDAH